MHYYHVCHSFMVIWRVLILQFQTQPLYFTAFVARSARTPLDRSWHTWAVTPFQYTTNGTAQFGLWTILWQTKIAMGNHHFQWVNPLQIAIFNGYVGHYQRVSGDIYPKSLGLSPHLLDLGFLSSHGYTHESNLKCSPKENNQMFGIPWLPVRGQKDHAPLQSVSAKLESGHSNSQPHISAPFRAPTNRGSQSQFRSQFYATCESIGATNHQ